MSAALRSETYSVGSSPGPQFRDGRFAPWVILGLGALAAILLLQLQSGVPDAVRFRAAVLWMMYLLPAAFYFAQAPEVRAPVPTLAILGAAHGLYYALPPIAGVVNAAYTPYAAGLVAWINPKTDLDPALDVAISGWTMLLIGYVVASVLIPMPRAKRRPLRAASLFSALWLLAAAGTAMEAMSAIETFPLAFSGTLGFVKLAGRYALTILVALRTRGRLPAQHGKYLWGAIIVQLVLLATSGSMANPMIFGLTLSFGFWIAGGRFRPRLVAGVLGAALVGITLKGVAGEYRQRTWWVQEQLSPVEEAVVMRELLDKQIETSGIGGAIVLGAEASMRRSATLDLLADVVRRTPHDVPYWGGETYRSLIGAFVPRFLWPSKPTKDVGNRFGHRYGYLASYDRWTSVNMPYLLEFYANFGFNGVLAGMFVTAFIIRLLDVLVNRPGSGILRATAGLIIVHPIFAIESDFSLLFGGLLLNGVALWIIVRWLERRSAIQPQGVEAGLRAKLNAASTP